MQNINELLKGFDCALIEENFLVDSIAVDSRDVLPGAVFFAYPGESVDGRDHIASAIEQGAKACVVEAREWNPEQVFAVPVVPVSQLKAKLSRIASRFYHYPSQQTQVIGVTGTNGKSSCVNFLAQALHAHDDAVGVLSTVGNGVWPSLKPSPLTTLGAVELQRQLSFFCQRGVDTVAMEVSSHALVQGRVDAVHFDIGVFTNLTHDHLDYHGDMDRYAEAKYKLFSLNGINKGVVNWDDPYGRQLVKRYPNVHWIGFGLNASKATCCPLVTAESVYFEPDGMRFTVVSPWGRFACSVPLLGQFNVQNVLAVVGVLGLKGLSIEKIETLVSRLGTLPGRMELIRGRDCPTVVVDFAHTPDAIEQALKSLRHHCQGRLWCVFGCGGDRDRSKRSVMASVVERLADQVVVTSDNPRMESEQQIVDDIFKGFVSPQQVQCLLNRVDAIKTAITKAKPEDIVLLAGKGHEEYQWVQGERLDHSDRRLACDLVKEV